MHAILSLSLSQHTLLLVHSLNLLECSDFFISHRYEIYRAVVDAAELASFLQIKAALDGAPSLTERA